MNLVVKSNDGTPVTTSEIISANTGNQHKNVLELVKQYQSQLEEFGPLAFETRMGKPLPQGGFAKATEFSILNEPQSTFVLTLMRNSEIVVKFKLELVKEFYAMRVTLDNLPPALAKQFGGIIKSVVHKQIEEALRESLPQLIHGAIAASHTGVRHGITAGQIMETYGLQKIKGGAQHLSRCLVKLACLIDGSGRAEMGTRTAKLFDPDRVAAQMKIGGMVEQYKRYVQERKGQGNLFAMRPI